MINLHRLQLEPIIKRALEEDWGVGDWTTDLCVPSDKTAEAQIIAKQQCVIAGIDIAAMVFQYIDPKIEINSLVKNSQSVEKKQPLLEMKGNAQSLLKGERVALNFLSRLSGIATKTKYMVDLIKDYPTQLLDTRKTTPGLRLLEKYAVRMGGARNHRLCLTDGVMIKENHIRAAGSIEKAVSQLHDSLPPTLKIEVEVNCLEELYEAMNAGVDLVMLDNMSPAETKLAVKTVNKRVLLESSGNITEQNIRSYAETGVDFISTSSILHSAPWADLSMLFKV